MGTKDKVQSLTAHIEKTKNSLNLALSGKFPLKHETGKEAYIMFLQKELMLNESTLAKLKGG